MIENPFDNLPQPPKTPPRTPDRAVRNWMEVKPTEITFLEIPKEFFGKPRSALIKSSSEELKDKDKYDFPGLAYFNFLKANPDKVPEILKNENHRYFFIGSNISGEVPNTTYFFTWDGKELIEGGGPTAMDLEFKDRVLTTPNMHTRIYNMISHLYENISGEPFEQMQHEIVMRVKYLRDKYPDCGKRKVIHILTISTKDPHPDRIEEDFPGDDSVEKFVNYLVERYGK